MFAKQIKAVIMSVPQSVHVNNSALTIINEARPTSGMPSLYRFGFMPDKGTTNDIFIMPKVEEKNQATKKRLY